MKVSIVALLSEYWPVMISIGAFIAYTVRNESTLKRWISKTHDNEIRIQEAEKAHDQFVSSVDSKLTHIMVDIAVLKDRSEREENAS